VAKVAGALYDGDEKVKFTLQAAPNGLLLGEKKELTLSFSEIVATQATMNPGVGGALQPNKVFVDLSANRQQSIARGAWDLGFYTVDGQFRVIINTSSNMLARQINKNDLAAVTAADTVGFSTQLSTDAIFAAINAPTTPGWILDSKNWVDDPAGDMMKTAIAEVASTESNNKVYIINRGQNPDGSKRGWKKVRVLRSGAGYTLQHADIGATSFSTLQVAKNDAYLFNYINFATGSIEVEPKKEQWDIAFTVFTNITTNPPFPVVVPYVFLDVVLQNRYQVQTVQVLNVTVTYDNFTEANLAGLAFSSLQANIGSSWRSGGGPSSGPALRTDRFYVVKDGKGNIYKLKFTALTQGGERGKPQIQFALVKKGI
jgi:hypothetical protein